MINKNDYRKINDKKILHKSGKTWKVVSLALLLAIGGGATVAATNANANADATDNAYNDAQGVTSNVAAQAQQLENDNYYGGSAKASVAPKSASKVTVAPKKANISYAPSAHYDGNNASAASYKNNEAFDKAEMAYYGPIVSGYVNEINARYPEAVSLENQYNDYSGETENAKSAANSYSATAQNSNTANVISAKASAAHQTTSDYTDSVAYHVLDQNNGFINEVSNDAKNASEDSVVSSYANLIRDIHNNKALSLEYNAKAREAEANVGVQSAYANNASNALSSLETDSDANINALNDNVTKSISMSANENIAEINSGRDAGFVESVAAAAGFKYNSTVVSSAISQLASDSNASNPFSNDNYITHSIDNNVFTNNFNGQVSVGTDGQNPTLVFSATGTNSSAAIEVGGYTSSYSDMASANRVQAANRPNLVSSANDALGLINAVSDTATQESYDSAYTSLNSAINTEKANKASYAVAVSSASEVYVKASNAYSDASSEANTDRILGNDPTIASIFASNASTTYFASGDVASINSVVSSKASDHIHSADAVNALSYFGFNVNTQYSDATNDANAVSSASAALSKAANSMESVASNDSNYGETSSLNNVKNGNSYYLSVSNGITGSSASAVSLLSLYGVNSTIAYATATDVSNAVKDAFTSASSDASALINSYNSSSLYSATSSTSYTQTGILNGNSYSNNPVITTANAYNNGANQSVGASVISGMASTAASEYNVSSVASASYAKATDQDVTIASQFTSYYNSIASSDASLTSNAKASLDNFRATHASNPAAYASANSAFQSASNDEPNDRDFAYAYGKNVLINTPEYITVKKNAMLHSDTQYAKSNSVESVKAGTQFAVKGVGFDLAGNVRFVVADAKGKNLYITGNDQYVQNTYLAPSIDYTVTLAKGAVAHNTLGFHKDAEGTIPANTQLEGYTVPTSTTTTRRDAAYGVTRLQVKGGKYNGDYITTNCKYFSNVIENDSNNAEANADNSENPVQHTINFAD